MRKNVSKSIKHTESPTPRGTKNKPNKELVQVDCDDMFGDNSSNKKISKKGKVTETPERDDTMSS